MSKSRFCVILTSVVVLSVEENRICDPFWENVPKVEKTSIEIRLKVGNNSILTNVTGSEKRYIVAHIFKIELLAPRGRVNSQL